MEILISCNINKMRNLSCLCRLLLVISTLASLVSGKIESGTKPISDNPEKLGSVQGGRQYHISNRDSYVDAANAMGHNKGSSGGFNSANLGGQAHIMSTYQAPQSMYGIPSQTYGVQYGGWGNDDEEQSSKGGSELLGYVGLLGLKGLKGTIPVIKSILISLIALAPFLIPLALVKFFIILFKPVLTVGRASSKSMTNLYDENQPISETLGLWDLYNSTIWNEEIYNNIVNTTNAMIGNDILGKDADQQCMQRIACEGVFKSLPRIFLKILGESAYRVSRKRRDIAKQDNNEPELDKPNTGTTGRRKDLVSVALNRLRNPQYLTRISSTADDYKNSEEVCKQYKCSNLF